MQIKTTISHYFIPTRLKRDNIKYVQKFELSDITGGKVKCIATLEKVFANSSKC